MTRWLRIFLLVIASLYAWLAAYFFVFRSATGFEAYNFLGGMALASVVLSTVPELIFISRRVRDRWNGNLRVMLGSVITFTLMLSWLGTLRWYLAGWGYDSFVHFAASAGGAVVALLLLLLVNQRLPRSPVIFIGLLVLLVVFGGVVNELFEKYGDLIWGTEMFGEPGELDDTLRDFAYNVIGAVLGSVICVRRSPQLARYLKRK